MKCETGDLQNAAARAEVCERFPFLEHVLLLLILQLCWEMQVTVEQQMSLCYSPARRNASCQTVFPALCSETDKTQSRSSLSCSLFRDLL